MKTQEQQHVYDVCNIIANQMGGKRFIESTKATPAFYTSIKGNPALVYDLPEGCKYTRMMIIYDEGWDNYKMGFLNSDGDVQEIHNDVYCDQLQDIFSSVTGISTDDCRMVFA